MHKSSKLHISYFFRWRLLIFYTICSWDSNAVCSSFRRRHFHSDSQNSFPRWPKWKDERKPNRIAFPAPCLCHFLWAIFFVRSCVTCKFPQSDFLFRFSQRRLIELTFLRLLLPPYPSSAPCPSPVSVFGLTVRGRSAHIAWLFI